MKYYVYDFDGTIYDGDSGVDIVKFAIKKRPKALLYVIGSIPTILLYLLKLKKKEDFKSKIFRFVKDIDDKDKFIEEFWSIHEKKLKKFWLDKYSHDKDIISSASCYYWLDYISKKYKIRYLFATNMDSKTGKIIGKNCHGKEKVRLFYEKFPKGIIEEAYSDSKNDLPLLEEAKKGFFVKKDDIIEYKKG